MRLNPRQRWEEDGTSNIAGVPGLVLAEFATLAPNQIMREIERTEHERHLYAAEDQKYKTALAEINGAIVRGLVIVLRDNLQDWIDLGPIKMRRGRGGEMTIVAKNYSDFRSWLTNVSLALYERYSKYDGFEKWSAHDKQLKHILDMLEKSSDRRPFNQYSYRDMTYGEIGRVGVKRRLENVRGDRKLRLYLDRLFAEMRAKKEQGTP